MGMKKDRGKPVVLCVVLLRGGSCVKGKGKLGSGENMMRGNIKRGCTFS